MDMICVCTIAIVHACSMATMHARSIAVVHACTVITIPCMMSYMVHSCTLAVEAEGPRAKLPRAARGFGKAQASQSKVSKRALLLVTQSIDFLVYTGHTRV